MIYDINGALIASDNPLGLHERPKTDGQLNAVKRARQMTDIKWVPVGTFDRTEFRTPRIYPYPHVDFVDEFIAGKEYIGVPYSAKRRLGTDISFETFATAVRTPNSVQMLQSDYDPSPDAEGLNASYYGSTCVNLTSYALDIPYITSLSYPTYPGMQRRYKILDNGVLGDINGDLQLADILQIQGHCAIVTDIMRDSEGSVTNIEVSEAVKGGNQNISHKGGEWGGKAQRVMWSFADFLAIFGGYTVYRYQYLDTVKYLPSVYVPMVDEGKKYAILDYPVIPYYGNKAIIDVRNGATVKLLINSTAYTHVAVEKDGVMFGDLMEINGADYVNVACPSDEAEYEAYLVNLAGNEITERTYGCKWYTMPTWVTAVSMSGNIANVEVKMKSPMFFPWSVTFGTDSGFSMYNARRVYDYDYSVVNNFAVYNFTSQIPISSPTKIRINMRSNNFGNVQRDFDL